MVPVECTGGPMELNLLTAVFLVCFNTISEYKIHLCLYLIVTQSVVMICVFCSVELDPTLVHNDTTVVVTIIVGAENIQPQSLM